MKQLQYKCIVLDHDDTTVNTTPLIHYQSYINFMNKYKPNSPQITLQQWYVEMWDKNLFQFLSDYMKLNETEMKQISEEWMKLHKTIPIQMFEGFYELMTEYKQLGGIVCICSHSQQKVIQQFYDSYRDGILQPDCIFGLEKNEIEKCKPYTYPIEEIMRKYQLEKKDIVVIDDLYHGLEMARRSGVDAIGTLYGIGHELVEKLIKEMTSIVVHSIDELRSLLIIN